MADTVCVVCGEPWAVDHVNHSMPLWKHLLFRAGKGCECCEGRPPLGGVDSDRVLSVLLNGGDDVDQSKAAEALEAGPKDYSAEWEDPPPKLMATCEGCGFKAEISQDEIYPFVRDGKQIGRVSFWVGKREIEMPLDEIVIYGAQDSKSLSMFDGDFVFQKVHDKIVCQDCFTQCDRCNVVLFDGEARDEFCDDTYSPGNSFYEQEEACVFCIECLESRPHCAKCDGNFPHDTEMKEDKGTPGPLCPDCWEEFIKVACVDCGRRVPSDEIEEARPCGCGVCDVCGVDDHKHEEDDDGDEGGE